VKLEAWVVGITAGSREVPGRKGLWKKTSISYNNNNNNNNNNNLIHARTIGLKFTFTTQDLQPHNNRSKIYYFANKCDETNCTRVMGPISVAAIKEYNELYRNKLR